MNPDFDLIFAIGLILGVLSVPSLLSAMADKRVPWVAAVVMIISGVMIVWAVQEQPDFYTFKGIPDLFVRVVARYIL